MATSHISPFSGSWYPGIASDLNRLLDEIFAESHTRTGHYLLPDPIAFVVPHVGLAYSGTVAASAYRYLQVAKPKRVFVLGFCHRGGWPRVAIPDVKVFQTPLGDTFVDRPAAMQLAAKEPFELVEEPRVCDHSLELQLPLLKRAQPEAAIVPIYVGDLTTDQRTKAAHAIERMMLPGDILLASSDFTHYGRAFSYVPFPADDQIASRLRHIDLRTIDAASSLDASLFLNELSDTGATMCGREPVALLLRILSLRKQEEGFQESLDYTTSGEITGDYRRSVSYGALGYFPRSSFQLDEQDCESLLKCAADSLAQFRTTGRRLHTKPPQLSPPLTRHAGVFVSVYQGSTFFGCQGCLTAARPLPELVAHYTLAAALDDPRRPKVRGIPQDLELKISVLTPMKRIRAWDSVRPGRDGVYLESGQHSGVLLPHVATEHQFTARAFLEAVSQKAGLSPKAYRDRDARLFVFQAQMISGRFKQM